MGSRLSELKKLGWGHKELKELLEELSATPLAQKQNKEKETYANELDLDMRIHNILVNIGMPVHLTGYNYVHEAVKYVFNNPASIYRATKELYPAVAAVYSTTWSRVEKDIRDAINAVWRIGNFTLLQNYFGFDMSQKRGKPTSRQFIATVAKILSLRENVEK